MLVAVLLRCTSFLKPQPFTGRQLTVLVIIYSCFTAGLLQNSDFCVWVQTVGKAGRLGFRQECCSCWMFARYSRAKLLAVWTHKHRTMCSCKEGRIEKRTEAGSEVLMHDCVSVCSTHCYSLCFVSHFSTTGFSTFLPFPLFMQTDLRLFATELYSRCSSGTISI